MTTPSPPSPDEASREIAEVKRQALTKEYFDGQVRVFSALYDKANAYTNAIIVVGYAGFFGLWSLTKPFLGKTPAIIAAGLMAISLATFVLFEVYKLLTAGRAIARRAAAMFDGKDQPDMQNFVRKLRDFEAANNRDALRLSRASPWMLGLTLAFGLCGYTVLLAVFACSVISE